MKATILIANYNNQKYLKDCINSLLKQSYKNKEIIFFDDKSNDNSIKEAKKFKNIIILKNNKIKKKYGSYNQINSYKQAFKKSTGDIIFFLDSDDFFHPKKIDEVIKKFKKNRNAKVIFDMPIIYFNKKKKFNKSTSYKFIKSYWPYIPPQSCIAIKRKYVNKVFSLIDFNRYPSIWMDFRVGIVSKYIFTNFLILKKNLTFYRQTKNNISSNFKHLSKNWWNRRMHAHAYIKYFFKKNKIVYKKNLDFYLTSFFNKII